MAEPTKEKEETTTTKEGTTTTKKKTGKRKWLGRIGTFLVMGGWILVLIVVLGLVIGISIWTGGC